MVAAEMGPESPATSGANFFWRVAPRMVSKMRWQDSSDMSVKDRKLKWRSRRLDTGLRPPPGGPMHPTKMMSWICRNAHGGLRSYHPWWSIHCRSSSMGGCAKYFSRIGMLRSSMRMAYFLPAGGPNTPFLRLSILESMKSWVWLAEVRALNVMNTLMNCSGMWLLSLSITFSVLPVPVSPTHSTWLSLSSSLSMTYVYRTVSAVGTMISANACSGLTLYAGMVFIHSFHASSSWSKQYSYMLLMPLSVGGMCSANPPSVAFLRRNSSSLGRPGPVQEAHTDQMMEKHHMGSAHCLAPSMSSGLSGSNPMPSTRSYRFSSAFMILNNPITRHVSTVVTVSFRVLRRKNSRPSMPGMTWMKMARNCSAKGCMRSGRLCR
mmetsp:Transcript_14901/g.36049  ORF Transcript_14901/g.36049 Transcript_14901/m.36049 type:complete len:378 (-) Transcript_14901:66-1199(-)